jgi:serine protease Do
MGVLGARSVIQNVNAQQTNQPVAAISTQEATGYAKSLSKAFRDTAEKVLPSVVSIQTHPAVAQHSSKQAPSANSEDENDLSDTPFGEFFNNPEFRRFFGQMPGGHGFMMPSPHHGGGLGSGVIIDSSGIILTNNHVVDDAGKITVRLHDGREFDAYDVKRDPKTDLAVLRIHAKNLPAAKLGDSSKMAVGDWVLALGEPFGLEGTVTAGIISAKQRDISGIGHGSLLQTDAAINPGNSGGPLVNLDGEVIGINTAISTQSGGYQGVGFAIATSEAKWVVNQLVKTGTVKRAYLGVAIQQVTAPLADQLGIQAREGVLVGDVQPGTPAAKAGVKTGDVIVKFNGQRVASPTGLQNLVEQTPIGSAVPAEVIRDGKSVTLNVTAEQQPANFGMLASRGGHRPGQPEGSKFEKLGLEVSNLTDEVAEQLELKAGEGVVVTQVQPGGPAEQAGLTAGMVISQADRKPVKTVADLERILRGQSLEKGVLLLVRDNQGSRFIVVRPEK